MGELQKIVQEENIVLPIKDTRHLRIDYINAITLARYPNVAEDSNQVNQQDQEDTLAKKMISGNHNVIELIAIVAKEKIVMKKGKKVKQDYVDAIYKARK